MYDLNKCWSKCCVQKLFFFSITIKDAIIKKSLFVGENCIKVFEQKKHKVWHLWFRNLPFHCFLCFKSVMNNARLLSKMLLYFTIYDRHSERETYHEGFDNMKHKAVSMDQNQCTSLSDTKSHKKK